MNYLKQCFYYGLREKKSHPRSTPENSRCDRKKIFDLRKSTGLSLERFCARNEIPRISYSNLESGKNFHMTTLLKVLDAHTEVKSLESFFKGL